MNKEHQEEIEELVEWVIEQAQKSYGMTREDIVTIIENWCEENW